MTGASRSRAAAVGFALAVAGAAGPASVRPLAAQAAGAGVAPPPVRAALVLVPDSVRIGEPFMLGVTVRAEPGWDVRFPAVLPLGEGYEQLEPAGVRRHEPDEWRAYYPLVAWKTEPGELPPVDMELSKDGEVLTPGFRPPPLTVLSVLPGDETDLELRPARPFLARSHWPWLLILLALLALLAWLLLRRRRAGHAALAPGTAEPPVERAQRELRELRERWETGEVEGSEFFDGLETTLRRYAETTRDWPAGALLDGLSNGERALAAVLRSSALARFGRLEADRQAAPAALDTCDAWLRSESSSPPIAGAARRGPNGAAVADRVG